MPTPRLPFPTTPSEYIQAPTGGWSPDVPTWELPTDAAPLIENFQPQPGKIRVRPSYKVTADLTSSAVSLAGWVPYKHGTSLLTKRLFTSGYKVEPQNVHRVGTSVPGPAPPGPATQAPVEDAIYEVTGSTVTRHAIGVSGQVPGWQQVDFNGNKYALTYAGAAGGEIMPYNDGVTGWTSAVIQITSPSATSLMSGSPVGGLAMYGWLGRLWVAGGSDPSGLPLGAPLGSTTVFFYTNPIQALTGTAADWKDPHSGLYNQTDIDGEHTNPIVAMASVPAGLLFLRQNSVFIQRGTDPTTYVLRPVSKQAGCIDARSVVEMDSKVYFMSEQGFMVTDGVTVVNVSGALQYELYRQIATWNNAVFNSTGAWCVCDLMSDGKILVSFGAYSTGNVSVNYTMLGAFSAVFDPATGAWVKVSTGIAPTASTNLGPSIQGYGELATLGNTQVVKIEDNVSGTTVNSASSLHDVSTVGGAFTPITATWTTKSPQAALGGRQKIQIKTTYLDHAVSTGGVAATVAYQLTDRVTGGTLTTNSITASTNASDPRQYLERDEFHEVSDLGITVTLAGTNTTGAASVPKAEVHGIGLVFSGAADMRPIV